MADLGAAFGFYPQLNRRRQGSPADSANLPIDVLRGRLAGLLGLPADMANLLRSPSPTEMFGDIGYEAPAQFPYTTEKFLKDLPLAPTSRVGQVAGQAASFVPLNPMPAVRGVQKIGQMAGEELAATMMGQRPNSMMSKVVPQPLFAVAPEQGLLSTKTEPIESLLQTKPQAPVSDIGFYSATEQAALNLGRNRGTGQSFINDLMKAPDVKKEELAYTGLDDFLRDKPNVTKQEVQDFLANNRVDVQEVRLGEAAAEDQIGIAKRKEIFDKYEPQIQALYKDMDSYGYDTPREVLQSTDNRLRKLQEMRDAEANAYYAIPEPTPTRYQKYQLAGGENYREILLTLPEAKPSPSIEIQKQNRRLEMTREIQDDFAMSGDVERAAKLKAKADAIEESIKELEKLPIPKQTENYQSSHFDQPNILAHMRVNDRIDADGKKMLLVEEIQSDWHQAGREKGYKTDVEGQLTKINKQRQILLDKQAQYEKLAEPYTSQNKDAPSDIIQGWTDATEQLRALQTQQNKLGKGVPDAPFKDTWYQLALKRLTKYAADNGYERIGLTTGKQQAGRYALSNEVDEINVIGRTNMATGEKSKSVALDMKSGQSLRIGVNNDGIIDNVSDESIKNFMGKNLSEVVGKDIAKEIMLNNKKTISGEGLDIGGEGMKKYYDEIYPKFLDKYGKKYGASVGETQITTDYARDASGIPAQRPSKETIRYLDITPQMKEGTSKGQPLFAATPLLPATSLLDEEKRKEITSLLE
jgi:hypothetical protein